MIELIPVQVGIRGLQQLKCFAWSKGGRTPALDYIFGSPDEDQERIVDMLGHVAENGLPRNKERYRKLHSHDNLHELKRKPHRFLFFMRGNELVFTEAFKKSDSRKSDTIHYDRANRRRRDFERQEQQKR